MYKNIQDTVKYLQDLVSLTKDISREEMELFIIPSYTTLESATKNVDRSYVKLGARTCAGKMKDSSPARSLL